jgi:murein DD-endopeptidase MepM/ murein hydrolase activator NlpD
MIRHADNTAAAYLHLQKGSLLVKKNQQVARGQIIALSGNTGNSSNPHVHVDVRKYWNSPSDMGPTLPIKFQDKTRRCWRPRFGDVFESNNN